MSGIRDAEKLIHARRIENVAKLKFIMRRKIIKGIEVILH